MTGDISSKTVETNEITYALFEGDEVKIESKDKTTIEKPYKTQIVWRNVIAMGLVHALGIYGFTRWNVVKWQTVVFAAFLAHIGTIGVQVGAHRLWAHRTFKANFGLRAFLAMAFTIALQNDILEWSRDHRGHHKFSDTDADVHNSSRGFFYSHVGWLLVKKHPEVFRRGKTINLDDLKADPIVVFHRRFYIPLLAIFWAFLPTFIPVYFWGESAWYAFTVCVFTRYMYSLNLTWLVNSWQVNYFFNHPRNH